VQFHVTQLTTYQPDEDPPFDVYFQQILEQVQLAEELGFACWWFTEHHFLQYGGAVPNPAVMLAAAAARTSRIHLGSAISILPLRHPLQTAEDYAMVDVTSGGRLEFGIGLGNTEVDYTHYGVPRAESRGRFEEAAEIIAGAWTTERYSHRGRYWQLEDVALYPKPVQRPHQSVWVAGTSPESLGWAGRHGYNVMSVAHVRPPELVRPGIAAWQEGLRASGFDPATRHTKLHVRVWVDDDAARARATAERAIARYDTLSQMGRHSLLAPPPPDQYDWAGMRAQGRNVYGTPDEVVAGIRTAQQHFAFDCLGAQFNIGGVPHAEVMRAMRLFAREVMPAFA
jgi:alkanesulfonate monooxygenase SsuD/methylene tetrahydromethanopterin reductase-like flavin-dependent oxidoreductase (luciferase family)